MKNKKTIDDILEKYLTDENLENFMVDDLGTSDDICLFYYLSCKYLIATEQYEDLRDLYDEEAFYYNHKVLQELIYDRNYFSQFNEKIKIALDSFVQISREQLKNKKDNKSWEMLNDLLLTYHDEKNNNTTTLKESAAGLIYDEMEDRHISLFNFKKVLTNYSKMLFYDCSLFLLYKLNYNNEELQEKTVLESAIPYLNKIIELQLTYKYDEIYIRPEKQEIRKLLKTKKLSKKSFR